MLQRKNQKGQSLRKVFLQKKRTHYEVTTNGLETVPVPPVIIVF